MSNPRDFTADIADIPTANTAAIQIGAQFHVDSDGTEHRLILINGHGVDLAKLPDLHAALDTVAAVLNAA